MLVQNVKFSAGRLLVSMVIVGGAGHSECAWLVVEGSRNRSRRSLWRLFGGQHVHRCASGSEDRREEIR